MKDWLQNGKALRVDYPDQTASIIAQIIKKYAPATATARKNTTEATASV
jgi:hypothetical protein